jgi:micrococcal nuclease
MSSLPDPYLVATYPKGARLKRPARRCTRDGGGVPSSNLFRALDGRVVQGPLAASLLLAAHVGLGVPLASAAESIPACTGLEPGPQRTVARVIDGETVTLDDGSELRLIGALAPRALDAGAEPGQWPMEVAAKAELEALALGKSIEIGFGGERADRYGRLQGHAFIAQAGERRWVQGHMLEQGLARAYALADNRACVEALLASERLAFAARRGLWAEAAYHVRRVSSFGGLGRYRTTFQLIEGRIARVGKGRGRIYLNLAAGHRRGVDRRQRRGFSASMRRGELVLLGDSARDLQSLEGRYVRVRGWIEERNGPAVDLSAGGLFELLEEAQPGAENAGRMR